MSKRILLSAGLLASSLFTYAQDDTTTHRKIFEHHIGVQMNELIRQVFNFNNATTNTPANPYYLTYNINFLKSGWGLRTGIGYTLRSFATDDGITKNTTDINDLNARLGIEKAFHFSDKWSAGVGIDGTYANDHSKTNTVIRTTDSTTTIVTSDVTSIGFGAMGWLRYNITKNVVLGTETSFYYASGKQKQDITIRERNQSAPGGPYQTTTSKIDNKTESGVFSLPVVFYLMVRF